MRRLSKLAESIMSDGNLHVYIIHVSNFCFTTTIFIVWFDKCLWGVSIYYIKNRLPKLKETALFLFFV